MVGQRGREEYGMVRAMVLGLGFEKDRELSYVTKNNTTGKIILLPPLFTPLRPQFHSFKTSLNPLDHLSTSIHLDKNPLIKNLGINKQLINLISKNIIFRNH